MINTDEVQGHLDAIVELLKSEPDAAVSFLNCVTVWTMLDNTIRTVGPNGLRGEAARRLIEETGSSHMAAVRVRAIGGQVAASTVQRIANGG